LTQIYQAGSGGFGHVGHLILDCAHHLSANGPTTRALLVVYRGAPARSDRWPTGTSTFGSRECFATNRCWC
jgi:hypothetical protein